MVHDQGPTCAEQLDTCSPSLWLSYLLNGNVHCSFEWSTCDINQEAVIVEVNQSLAQCEMGLDGRCWQSFSVCRCQRSVQIFLVEQYSSDVAPDTMHHQGSNTAMVAAKQ